jgi:uncharacterized protein with HEPN domain
MKKREFTDYLTDIIDSINDIEIFVKELTFDDFIKDKKTINAVIRSLEVIGEATKKIPENFRSKHSSIPWKRMAGMRDKLIHEYFGVDFEILWKVIKDEIPPLKQEFEKIIKK